MEKHILEDFERQYPRLTRLDTWANGTALLCGALISHLGIIAPPAYGAAHPGLFVLELFTMIIAGILSIYCTDRIHAITEQLKDTLDIPEKT